MATRVRISNDGPHHIIVGTQRSREIVNRGNSVNIPVSEGAPIVITEYESDLNELESLVLPTGYKQ